MKETWDIWKQVHPTRGSIQVAQGTTLAAAIRDAGVRCSTCEHRLTVEEAKTKYGIKAGKDGYCLMLGDDVWELDFFCAHHTLLTKPPEEEG